MKNKREVYKELSAGKHLVCRSAPCVLQMREDGTIENDFGMAAHIDFCPPEDWVAIEPPKRKVKMAPAALTYPRGEILITTQLFSSQEEADRMYPNHKPQWLAGTGYELEVEVD
jgi:hypothetical protein